jgi:hypothetical protein
MNIYDQFPSKYLKAGDLQGRSIKAKVGNIVQEILGNDTKMVIYFANKEKGMVCNRTNAMTLAEAWGPDTDNWIGGDIEIFSTKVPFQGKLTDSLRVRPIVATPAVRPIAPRQTAPANQPLAPPPASEADYGAIDDDIPF